MMIVKLEVFDKNVEGMRYDLNSIIGLCTSWPEGTEENLCEDSHSPDGYINTRSPVQNQKF